MAMLNEFAATDWGRGGMVLSNPTFFQAVVVMYGLIIAMVFFIKILIQLNGFKIVSN